MSSLPVINYQKQDRESLCQEVVHSMETLGFMFLENVPGFDEDELRWCVDFFFNLPLKKRLEVAKKKYNPDSKQMYRGYFGTNKVGSSYKEAYEVGKDLPVDDPDYKAALPFSEHTPYPQPDENEDPTPYNKYRAIMLQYYDLLQDVSLNLLRIISVGLGLDEHYFDCLFAKPMSTLRIINYPKHDFEIPDDAYGKDGKLLSTAAHRDTSVLTLLSTFDYEGLQVEREDGSWLDVVPRKNSLIVNLGAILCRMTDNKVKATNHRVLAIGRPRQSAPFFIEPSFFALLPKRMPTSGENYQLASDWPESECEEYGPLLVKRIQRYVEWQGYLDSYTFQRPQ